jgi:mannose-6-phosphate isomerase
MLGLAPGTTPEAVEAALGSPDIVPLVRRVPARVGDVHHLPPGLVHAVGAGVVVAEVETPSDTTFRLYDWTREYGRSPRDLHTEQAMASIRSAWDVNLSPPPPVGHDGLVVSSDAYTITRQTTPDAQTVQVAPRPLVRIVLTLAGRLSVTGLDEDLRAGELAILPACWDGGITSEAGTTWLDVDVVAPG